MRAAWCVPRNGSDSVTRWPANVVFHKTFPVLPERTRTSSVKGRMPATRALALGGPGVKPYVKMSHTPSPSTSTNGCTLGPPTGCGRPPRSAFRSSTRPNPA